MLTCIIAKPTHDCNANCVYCITPSDNTGRWSFDDFKRIFDKTHSQLQDDGIWLWHGGEPMMMGPDFFYKTYEYAKKIKPNINFAMQSNCTLYTSKKWKDLFVNCFNGCISTSFDPDERNRKIKDSSESYTKLFMKKLELMMDDGMRPLIIGVYSNQNIEYANKMYELSKSRKDRSFGIRINYIEPQGRAANLKESMDPILYAKKIIEIFDLWIMDNPNFIIQPINDMLLDIIRPSGLRCPKTHSCAKTHITIEPNGDVFTCCNFASMHDDRFKFGNLLQENNTLNLLKPQNQNTSILDILNSNAARTLSRRKFYMPNDCVRCEHNAECKGGCIATTMVYTNTLGGKDPYCAAWKMIYSHFKKSIVEGRADNALSYMIDADAIKRLKKELKLKNENLVTR